MLNKPLKDRRLQPIVRFMRRPREQKYEYQPHGRLVKFERKGDQLVRWLTCLHCGFWYVAPPNAPVHCGKAECSEAILRRKRKSRAAWI